MSASCSPWPPDCGSQASLGKLVSCFATGVPAALASLATIMTRLRAAAPGVRVAGMTYYLPALAAWRHGTPGQVIARLSEKLAAGYSELPGRAYAGSGARVADVFSAFGTSNFGDPVTVPGIGTVPRNVALVWGRVRPDASEVTGQVGDIVLAMGNPLGLASSVTDGIISAVGRTVSEAQEAGSPGATLPDVIQTPGGPAAKAGLQSGDVITAVNGTATPDTEALAAVLAGLRPGQQVPVSVTKADGSTTTIHLTLGQPPGS